MSVISLILQHTKLTLYNTNPNLNPKTSPKCFNKGGRNVLLWSGPSQISAVHSRKLGVYKCSAVTVKQYAPPIRGLVRTVTVEQFTCPKGHLSETYRHRVRVRVRVRFSVKFRNLHNYISDK